MNKEIPDQEMSKEVADALRDYLGDIATDTCPFCKTKIEDKKQVGRCVYALPCYHRLYQGTLPKRGPFRHPYLEGKDTWEEV